MLLRPSFSYVANCSTICRVSPLRALELGSPLFKMLRFRYLGHTITISSLVLLLFSIWYPGLYQLPRFWRESQPEPKTVASRVASILRAIPSFGRHGSLNKGTLCSRSFPDGHLDLAYNIRWTHNNHIYQKNFIDPFESGHFTEHVDLARLRAGQLGGSSWSTLSDGPKNGSNITSEYFAEGEEDLLSHPMGQNITQTDLACDSRPFHTWRRSRYITPSLYKVQTHVQHSIRQQICNEWMYSSPAGSSHRLLSKGFISREIHSCANAYADSALVDLPTGGVAAAQPC